MAKISGLFCERKLNPKKTFDPDSFRWTRSNGNWLLIGCPRGKWSKRRERCRVGTKAYVILAKKTQRGRCTKGKTVRK